MQNTISRNSATQSVSSLTVQSYSTVPPHKIKHAMEDLVRGFNIEPVFLLRWENSMILDFALLPFKGQLNTPSRGAEYDEYPASGYSSFKFHCVLLLMIHDIEIKNYP